MATRAVALYCCFGFARGVPSVARAVSARGGISVSLRANPYKIPARAGFLWEIRHVSIVWFLLIGLAAGWLAGKLVKGRGFGLVENLIIGVIGALIGGFVFGALGVNVGGLPGQLIAATVGALILLYLLKLIRRA
jgi:uncharacterized membrane protein YeaQ/YmgE (transglycosylase-associated protein family)